MSRHSYDRKVKDISFVIKIHRELFVFKVDKKSPNMTPQCFKLRMIHFVVTTLMFTTIIYSSKIINESENVEKSSSTVFTVLFCLCVPTCNHNDKGTNWS